MVSNHVPRVLYRRYVSAGGGQLVVSGRLDVTRDVFLLLHLGAELGDQVTRLRQHCQLLVE